VADNKDADSGAPLAGRIAVVTGGSRGIGRAICVALARGGAAVAVNYRRDAAAAEQLAAELTATAHAARAFRASLESNAEIEDMVAAVSAEFGPPDILVNCAGVASRGQPVADTDPAEPYRCELRIFLENNSTAKPLHHGTVGVIDGRSQYQYVLNLDTGKGSLRPLNEAQTWDADRSQENPTLAEQLRQTIYSRFPSLVQK